MFTAWQIVVWMQVYSELYNIEHFTKSVFINMKGVLKNLDTVRVYGYNMLYNSSQKCKYMYKYNEM